MGLFVILAVYVVLGFLLAWIAAMVAQEDVDVKTGVLVLFLAGIISAVAKYALLEVLDPLPATLCIPVVNFGVLMLMLNLIAKLTWKHSAIIAAIYSVVIGLLFFGLSSCAAAA